MDVSAGESNHTPRGARRVPVARARATHRDVVAAERLVALLGAFPPPLALAALAALRAPRPGDGGRGTAGRLHPSRARGSGGRGGRARGPADDAMSGRECRGASQRGLAGSDVTAHQSRKGTFAENHDRPPVNPFQTRERSLKSTPALAWSSAVTETPTPWPHTVRTRRAFGGARLQHVREEADPLEAGRREHRQLLQQARARRGRREAAVARGSPGFRQRLDAVGEARLRRRAGPRERRGRRRASGYLRRDREAPARAPRRGRGRERRRLRRRVFAARFRPHHRVQRAARVQRAEPRRERGGRLPHPRVRPAPRRERSRGCGRHPHRGRRREGAHPDRRERAPRPSASTVGCQDSCASLRPRSHRV